MSFTEHLIENEDNQDMCINNTFIPLNKRTIKDTTIKQLNSIFEQTKKQENKSNIVLHGQPLTYIRIAGYIKQIRKISGNCIELSAGDDSGYFISIKNYAEVDDDITYNLFKEKCEYYNNLPAYTWLEIIGFIFYDESISEYVLNSIYMQEFENKNYLSLHWLQCIHDDIYYLQNNASVYKKQKSQQQLNISLKNNDINDNIIENNINAVNTKNIMTNTDQISNTHLKTDINNIIEHADEENGCSRKFIYTQLSKYNTTIIDEYIAELRNDGFCYSTIDDDHFKHVYNQK